MQAITAECNATLRDGLVKVTSAIAAAAVPAELAPYRRYVLDLCGFLREQVDRNLADIATDGEVILEDLISNTQVILALSRKLSAYWAGPILRYLPADRLALRTITWVHGAHDVSREVEAALGDGGTAIYPLRGPHHPVPIYYLPCAEQRGLRFQPLLFHEFGHLLYDLHRPEMEDLVVAFRRKLRDALQPGSRRNDRHAAAQAHRRQEIVETWHSWIQEIFCDTVGLVIGGPAFLLAFSEHLSAMDPTSFRLPPAILAGSTHPVTWLRIQLLSVRARTLGYAAAADEVSRAWTDAAAAHGVRENYEGYFEPSFAPLVSATVDDMLIEASPRPCTPGEATGVGWEPMRDSVVRLFNSAWESYRADPEGYSAWEQVAIGRLIREEQ